MKVEEIAYVCHEANRAYCNTIGDDSQKCWDQAEDWQRESAIKGVQFHIDNPEAGPCASHASWLNEKQAQGWKYGPVKDAEKKEHPCFLCYSELPVEQQAKDKLFTRISRVLIPLLPCAEGTEPGKAQEAPCCGETTDGLVLRTRDENSGPGGERRDGGDDFIDDKELSKAFETTDDLVLRTRDQNVTESKQFRKDLDPLLQSLKNAVRMSPERSLAVTKIQEAIMWLGMDLKAMNEPNPYPNSRDTTNTIVDPTADGLKL